MNLPKENRSLYVNSLSKFYCLVGIAGLLLFSGGCGSAATGEKSDQQAFIDSLLSTMSLEAKVGEMTQLTLGAILQKEKKQIIEPQDFDSLRAAEALIEYQVGSILNCGDHAHTPAKWHAFITGSQERAAQK